MDPHCEMEIQLMSGRWITESHGMVIRGDLKRGRRDSSIAIVRVIWPLEFYYSMTL